MAHHSEIILYLTAADADVLREWINAESEVAWIIKASQVGCVSTWKAVDHLDRLEPQTYKIWHTAGSLAIPSGRQGVPGMVIPDPWEGWTQELERENAPSPWIGEPFPTTYTFYFREQGRSAPNALARSGFAWTGNRFRLIGRPARPDAMKWWQRLRRYIAQNSTRMPWPLSRPSSRINAFVFKEAYAQIADGRAVDANPRL